MNGKLIDLALEQITFAHRDKRQEDVCGVFSYYKKRACPEAILTPFNLTLECLPGENRLTELVQFRAKQPLETGEIYFCLFAANLRTCFPMSFMQMRGSAMIMRGDDMEMLRERSQ